jgi:hypothetical protein
MRRPSRGGGHGEEEVPWASFADALTGLLFVFILLTVMFVFAAQQAKVAADDERESLTAADQRARAMVDAGDPRSFVSCLQGKVPEAVRLIPGNGADASALSIVIETNNRPRPAKSVAVGWFDTADAELHGLACDLTQSVGRCLAGVLDSGNVDASRAATPILQPGDVLRVFVEGHTDKDQMKPGERYPSNWELSGARAAAVVRALTVEPEAGQTRRCEVDRGIVNSVQQAMNGDNSRARKQIAHPRLELIAVGRADQAPSRAVVCKQADKSNLASNDEVCKCMDETSEAAVGSCERTALTGRNGKTHQQRLIDWANSTEDRKLSMRRVDLRFEVRPTLMEGSHAR